METEYNLQASTSLDRGSLNPGDDVSGGDEPVHSDYTREVNHSDATLPPLDLTSRRTRGFKSDGSLCLLCCEDSVHSHAIDFAVDMDVVSPSGPLLTCLVAHKHRIFRFEGGSIVRIAYPFNLSSTWGESKQSKTNTPTIHGILSYLMDRFADRQILKVYLLKIRVV